MKKSTEKPYSIRDAAPEDIPLIMQFIRDLARYEKSEDLVLATPESLTQHLFAPGAVARCILAEWEDQAAGFALYFYNFSTWTGKPGLYLEDLFVLPEYRQRGIGLQLMKTLAGRAASEGCERFEWSVLNWNSPAIDFYKSLGAHPMADWTVYRMDGDSLRRFASAEPATGQS